MSESRVSQTWKVRLVQLVLGVVAALLVTEGLFWVRQDGAFPHLNLYTPDAKLGARLAPSSSMRLRIADNPVTTVHVNGQGYRGRDWPSPEANEILVVGDSQVFGLGVEDDETFSAQLEKEMGGDFRVRNAGVPTYGPAEYRAIVEEVGRARRPRHVVLVFNMANDVLEARRPNTERHAIWDGWAVRKETAPAAETWALPGKSWLFNRSHAVFAFRRYWASREGATRALEENRLPSEGVFTDLVALSGRSKEEKAAAIAVTAARHGAFEKKIGELRDRATKSDDELVKELAQLTSEYYVPVTVEGGFEEGSVDVATSLKAARHNPGDIVGTIQYAESSGPFAATAQTIRRGAVLRRQLEKIASDRYAANRNAKEAAAVRLIDDLKKADDEMSSLMAGAPDRAFSWSPLKAEIDATKKVVEEWGAELTVLVLPFDVQVSADEWAKYGSPKQNMEETLILNEDVVRAARSAGARAVHPLSALRSASPGAFLRGDLHLTAKGHEVIAHELAVALRSSRPFTLPQGGLPSGRSRAPGAAALSVEVMVKGSSAARCDTYLRGGWFRGVCFAHEGDKPLAVRLRGGLSGEVQVFRADDAISFTLPFVPGNEVRGTVEWEKHSRTIELVWPADAEAPAMSMGPPTPVVAQASAAPLFDLESRFCECAVEKAGPPRNIWGEVDTSRTVSRSKTCIEGLLSPVQGCEKFAQNCGELLACANGDPWFTPECREGEANAGAMERCYPLCDPAANTCPEGSFCAPWQGSHVCFSGEKK